MLLMARGYVIGCCQSCGVAVSKSQSFDYRDFGLCDVTRRPHYERSLRTTFSCFSAARRCRRCSKYCKRSLTQLETMKNRINRPTQRQMIYCIL
ncbi:hypothetical protein FKM82_005327 [Ascaphus truei]